jgi:hypothetical protein
MGNKCGILRGKGIAWKYKYKTSKDVILREILGEYFVECGRNKREAFLITCIGTKIFVFLTYIAFRCFTLVGLTLTGDMSLEEEQWERISRCCCS